jgi:hypothetical protein
LADCLSRGAAAGDDLVAAENSKVLSDIQLLAIEIETLWVKNDRGRLLGTREANGRAPPHLVIAVSHDSQIAAMGNDLPDGLASDLAEAVAASPPPARSGSPPAGLARCRQLLESSVGAVEIYSGPSYVLPPDAAFPSTAEIHRSDGGGIDALQGKNSGRAGWSPGEWRQLLRGDLGPWAMATIGGRVVAICHTSRLGDRGAEAGVWTDPGFRGQGHAAAVTAAWASLFDRRRFVLFYSTSADNFSSQRVTARLQLREIGWTWSLRPRLI